MKHVKNSLPAIFGILFLITAGIISCSKKDSTPPPVIPKTTISAISPTSAYTGDTITITGSNFTGATAVSFGGTPAAAFKVISATSIQAQVGTGASGSVSVVAPGGTATLAGFTFNSGLPPVDGYSSSNDIEPNSLIGYWPFDGTSTEKVHSQNPILTGGAAPTYVTGKLGQAISLQSAWLTYDSSATSASSRNTPYASNDTLQNGFTLSLWAQAGKTENLSTLFQLSSPAVANWPVLGIQYRKHADSSFDFDGGLTNVDGTGTHPTYASAFVEPTFMDTASWAYLVMSYDTTSKSLNYYVNGTLAKSIDLKSAGGPFPDLNASLLMITPNFPTIGAAEGLHTTPGSTNAEAGYMSYGITATLDDIRLFNKTLTAKQINDLYILGNQGR